MEIAAFSQSSNSSSSPYPYQAQQIPATIHLNLEVKMERPPFLNPLRDLVVGTTKGSRYSFCKAFKVIREIIEPICTA